jgi:DNA-binding GntR family transcriptional regulator
MKADIIQLSSVSDEVYHRLRHQITHALIAPGERISLRQIAGAFGVSTMPVREALRKLEAEGFVQFETRSVIVQRLTAQEVREVFVVRRNLEILASEWAIRQVKSVDIERLRKILTAMNEQGIDHGNWQRLNREFHFQFYELSGSTLLMQLIRNVWDRIDPYMHIYTTFVTSLHTAQGQHDKILEFIEHRDLPALLELTQTHLSYTCEIIVNALSEP